MELEFIGCTEVLCTYYETWAVGSFTQLKSRVVCVCYKSQLKSSHLRVSGDLRSITSNEQSHYKMVLLFVLTVQYFEIFVMN
jgi:hypothetical protein